MNKENVDEMLLMEAQIKSVQAEIAALQGQHHQNERDMTLTFKGQMQDALLSLSGKLRGEVGDSGEKDTLAKLKAEVEEMEKDLTRQTQINNITLTSCNIKTLDRSDNKLVQQYRLTGYCFDLVFQVEFQLTEVKEDQSFERRITDLNIVMDTSDLLDFSSFVSGAEDRRDLLLFFRTLRRFSERTEDRRRTFQHFQEKYPAVVSLPEGCRSEVMTIHNPQLPGCVLFIHWSVEVTRRGGVNPKIELLTKIPETALQLDPDKVIEGAPESFQSLLRIQGTEAAIESVIKAMSM